MSKKRGQITTYMIVGMILLLTAAIFFYLKSTTTIFEPDKVIPAEFVPVKQMVEKCLDSLTRTALFNIGMHGGYVELPIEIEADPFSYVPLIENSPFKIPFWYYRGQNRMPSKNYIQQQISEYLNSNIRVCTSDFETFADKFDIEELGEIETETIIGDKKVAVKMDYEIEISDKQKTERTVLKEYYTDVPIGLGRIYELAKRIMEKENSEAFLERLTMEVVAGSGFPYEGFEVTCEDRTWFTDQQIKPELMNMIKYNLHFLTFKGTDYIDSGIQYFQNMYHIDLGPGDFADIRVNPDLTFNENWWMKLNIHPSTGGIVTSMNYDIPLIGRCFKIYHHFWDVEFPFVFQLVDEDGYAFHFATPVLVKRNLANRERDIYRPDLGDELSIPTSDDYCSDAEFDLRVKAADMESGEVLDGAKIDYRCVRYRCEIGNTSQPRYPNGVPIYGADPVLETVFPSCINGLLIAQKENYLPAYKFIDTNEGATVYSTTIEMAPLKELDYEFRVVDYPAETIRKLEEDETVIITLSNSATDYDETIYYPSDFADYQKMQVLLGDYTLKLISRLLKNGSVTGGQELDWEVNYYDLKNADKIRFYLLSRRPLPQNINETIELMQDIVVGKAAEYEPVII